jgi:hypothetical protein
MNLNDIGKKQAAEVTGRFSSGTWIGKFVSIFIVGMIAANDSECHGIETDSVDWAGRTSVAQATQLTINNHVQNCHSYQVDEKPDYHNVRSQGSSITNRRGVHQAQSSIGPSVSEQLATDEGKE